MSGSSYRASSEESVSTTRIVRRKTPYVPFFVITEEASKVPAADRYGPDNNKYVTVSISHGGNLRDRPGRSYRQAKVTYFAAVTVNRLDLHELSLLSERLGYSEMGRWYYFQEERHDSLELRPLSTEDEMASLRQVIRNHRFAKIENLYVEHGPAGDQYKLIPKEIRESGKKRIEKLIYLLLLDKPEASVRDGVVRVKSMIGVNVANDKMGMLMKRAREQMGMW